MSILERGGPTHGRWRTAQGSSFTDDDAAALWEHAERVEGFRVAHAQAVADHARRGGFVTEQMRSTYGAEIEAALGLDSAASAQAEALARPATE